MKLQLTTIIVFIFSIQYNSFAEDINYYTYLTEGRYYIKQPRTLRDPIPGPEPKEIAYIKEKGVKSFEIMDSLMGRIEAYYGLNGDIPLELAQWFDKNEKIKRNLLLAIDPIYDDARKVFENFEMLIRERPRTLAKYFHLAIALALVYDHPDAIVSSRYNYIWGVHASQFLSMPTLLEVYDFYTTSRYLNIKPDKLVWPLLIFSADLDLNKSEREYALKKFHSMRSKLPETYGMIKYDYNKLSRAPKLNSRPYSLENLFNPNIGGICGDQAYASSRIMKTFGMPALKVAGDSRYGGSMGHAWTGYLSLRGSKSVFSFSGRYNGDYYWTGTAFNPHTRRSISDRQLAMVLDGVIKSYAYYLVSENLTRVAKSLEPSEKELALELLWHSINKNPYSDKAWLELAKHYQKGHLSKTDASKFIRYLLTKLKSHPDLTWSIIKNLLETNTIASFNDKQKLYKSAFALYRKRPDLQVDLRISQCQYLFSQKKINDAVNLAFDTIDENAEQGKLIIPLAQIMVNGVSDQKKSTRVQCFNMLDRITEQKYPKTRGNQVVESYVELRRLVNSIDRN